MKHFAAAGACALAISLTSPAFAAPRPSPALPSWLAPVLRALPEMATEAGVDAAASDLDDLSDAGRTKQKAALDRAIRARSGSSPDARLARARLARERILIHELDPRERRPGAYLPAGALVQTLNLPGLRLEEQLERTADRLEKSSGRMLTGMYRPMVSMPSRYMVIDGNRETANCRRVIERVKTLCDTLPMSPRLRARIQKSSAEASATLERFADFLVHDVQPKSTGDARPGAELFARLLREGYGIEDSASVWEVALLEASQRARMEMDSLAASIDPRTTGLQMVNILRGTHPTAEDLVPSVRGVLRSAEVYFRRRWPGLPVESLELLPLGFGGRVEGQAASYTRPRPLRAATDRALFGIALIDVNFPGEVQEAFLSQSSFYFDSVLAARNDVPGETLLWSLHRNDPPARLWSAGNTPFRAWGYFGQQLASSSGQFTSRETRLFESWTRLLVLARGLEDLRLGRRMMGPQEAPTDLSNLTGVDRRECEGDVAKILEQPGREAATAIQVLALQKHWKALRDRGVPEAQALRRLAGVALYPPSVQARELGLAAATARPRSSR